MKTTYLYLLSMLLLATACMQTKSNDNEGSGAGNKFQEKFRPQVHFTPPKHWMNDPNGMVYYKGEYHLFYQHYPEKSVWGPMHWGHAISTDLVHWEHMPIAIYPDSLGYIFSGSAVADYNNTSGLGTKENPPLIAFFTYHDMKAEKEGRFTEIESQAIAYSLDKGRTWTKYKGNPVVKNPGIRDFRDPKVIWHKDTKQWIMSVASGQVIKFYASPNCLDWTYLSEFGEGRGEHGGVWECPDLFPLQVSGSNEIKWVLIVNINPGGPAGGSATQYFVGDFNGKEFISAQSKTQWMDYGKDNYAGVTWSNTPGGRRILIGWMNNWEYAGEKPCIEWSGAATFPRELGLVKELDTYLLTSEPVKEIEKLYGEKVEFINQDINGVMTISERIPFAKSPVDIRLRFDIADKTKMGFASKYGITLKNSRGEYITVGYDNVDSFFYVDRTNAVGEVFSERFALTHIVPFIANGNYADWRIVVDKTSLEFFAADNKVVITDLYYPTEDFDIIEIFAENGQIRLGEASITELKSIWK